MSEFLALNFDTKSSPEISLQYVTNDTKGSGWGLAWYPNDDYTSIVVKDTVQTKEEALSRAINDWKNFRSTVFMCKTKGVARQYTLHDIQPFRWSFAGLDWLFLHNGHLDKFKLQTLTGDKSDFLIPLGGTDSELLFCYILGKLHELGAKALIDLPPKVYLDIMSEIDQLGTADIILTDQKSIFVYRSVHSENEVYLSRLTPPNNLTLNESDTIHFQINDPRDPYRTCMVVSSEEFKQMSQTPMLPGEAVLIRRGALVWKYRNPSTETEANCSDTVLPLQQETSAQQQSLQNDEQQQFDNKIVNVKSVTTKADGSPMEFKQYEVQHSTHYEYTKPVEHSVHTFRLFLVEDQAQEVINSELTISVDGEKVLYDDVFGNQTLHYVINQPYTKLEITCKSLVKLFEKMPDSRSAFVRKASIPLVWMPWQRKMMSPYLLPDELPESQLRELTEYAMSFVERNDYNLLATLKDMNQTIYSDFEYVSGSTSLQTTPFDVFQTRKGVCQDFANLYICLTQLLSIPARYRVGYIYTGADYANKIQSEASHAWAETYIPLLGWKGFDPTNGCGVEQNHIRVACGRNYRDATPTTGTIFKGGGDETLSVDVKIVQC